MAPLGTVLRRGLLVILVAVLARQGGLLLDDVLPTPLIDTLPFLALTGGVACAVALLDLGRSARRRREEIASLSASLADERLRADQLATHQSNLRHEAINSLAGLGAVLDLVQVRDRAATASEAELVRAARCETDHLVHLLTRDGGARPVDHSADVSADISVDDVVGRVVAVRRAAGLQVAWQPSGLVAHAIPEDLAAVLHNLLVNAELHGGGRLVSVAAAAADGMVDVSVRDLGPGVPSQDSERIFDRGFRGRHSSGTGLGLHISRALMREQGGDLVLGSGHPGAELIARLPRGRTASLPRVIEPIRHPGAETMLPNAS